MVDGMWEVVGGVVIEVRVVGGGDEMIVMGGGEGDGINVVGVVLGEIFGEIGVEKENEEREEFKISLRGEYVFYVMEK